MPNHIQNRITADEATQTAIRARMSGDDGLVDFNRLIRMPEHQPGVFCAHGNLGLDEEATHPAGTWYSWSTQYWGTKWGPYGQPDKRDTPTLLHFQTAWSCPHPIVFALAAAMPEASFVWEYADEDFGYNLGRYRVESGRIFYNAVPEVGSAEAVAWAQALHGVDWTDDEEEAGVRGGTGVDSGG